MKNKTWKKGDKFKILYTIPKGFSNIITAVSPCIDPVYDFVDEETNSRWIIGQNCEPYIEESKELTKQTKGKLFYELDWNFIEGMAQRMAKNKSNSKYTRFGWKEGINIEDLKQANIRHSMEINKGNDSDDQEYGHYYALACNSMMILHEIKRLKSKQQ